MDVTSTQMINIGLFFLGLFISGFWLQRAGKPYPSMRFNLHKFIALGTAVYLGMTFIREYPRAASAGLSAAGIALTAVLFAVTIVAGGLLNTEAPRQKALLTIHHIFPYLTVLSTAMSLYLLFFH